MNDRQLRIAHMIRTGSARPNDLQELADSILAECHHPPSQIFMARDWDTGSTAGNLVCTLCDKPLCKYSYEAWVRIKDNPAEVLRVWEQCRQAQSAPPADVKAIVNERIQAHAAAGLIDLSKLPPGFGHSFSCDCDECVKRDQSFDPPRLFTQAEVQAELDAHARERKEPRTVVTIKLRDDPSDKRVQYFDPTAIIVESESLPGDRER